MFTLKSVQSSSAKNIPSSIQEEQFSTLDSQESGPTEGLDQGSRGLTDSFIGSSLEQMGKLASRSCPDVNQGTPASLHRFQKMINGISTGLEKLISRRGSGHVCARRPQACDSVPGFKPSSAIAGDDSGWLTESLSSDSHMGPALDAESIIMQASRQAEAYPKHQPHDAAAAVRPASLPIGCNGPLAAPPQFHQTSSDAMKPAEVLNGIKDGSILIEQLPGCVDEQDDSRLLPVLYFAALFFVYTHDLPSSGSIASSLTTGPRSMQGQSEGSRDARGEGRERPGGKDNGGGRGEDDDNRERRDDHCEEDEDEEDLFDDEEDNEEKVRQRHKARRHHKSPPLLPRKPEPSNSCARSPSRSCFLRASTPLDEVLRQAEAQAAYDSNQDHNVHSLVRRLSVTRTSSNMSMAASDVLSSFPRTSHHDREHHSLLRHSMTLDEALAMGMPEPDPSAEYSIGFCSASHQQPSSSYNGDGGFMRPSYTTDRSPWPAP